MVDIERLDLLIEKRLERLRRRYNVSYADLAWILLRIGTNYYFRDISGRRLDKARNDSPAIYASDIQRLREEQAVLHL